MITTHVLDIARGKPAAGVGVALAVRKPEGWVQLRTGRTDERGRLQRGLEGLQHAEGQLTVSGRTRDAVLNGAAQLRGGLRQLIAGRAAAPVAR